MESLRSSLAAILCCSLCFPASLGVAEQTPVPASKSVPVTKDPGKAHARPAYQSTQLRGDERILHALNRFTFGPRAGDLEAVRAEGLDKWFDRQLHPELLDESGLSARLAEFPEMQWSTVDLLYRLPSNGEIRQAMNTGKVPIPADGTLHAIYENQIYRLQTKKAEKAQGNNGPGKPQLSANGGMEKMDAAGGMAMSAGQAGSPEQAMSGNAMAANSSPMSTATPMEMSATTDAQPLFDEAAIADLLALAPAQRVTRLAAMQPEEFDGFIKALRPPQRVQLNAGLNPELKLTVRALENPERTVGEDLLAERLTRDIYSNAQLDEVMTDFWLNHFNVYLRKNEQTPYYLVSYARDTIRPRALGKFEDLLEAVAHSPAMLAYLDNAESIGPESPAAERAQMAAARRPDAKKKPHQGLNENYARELMELHTLGVNGGYTQADVTQVARVLTGWGIERPQVEAAFSFNPNRHEPGTKKCWAKRSKRTARWKGANCCTCWRRARRRRSLSAASWRCGLSPTIRRKRS